MILLRSHSENQEIITVPKNCCQNFFFLHTCKYKSSLCITTNKYNVIYSRTLNKFTDSVTSADSEMTSTQTKKPLHLVSTYLQNKKNKKSLNNPLNCLSDTYESISIPPKLSTISKNISNFFTNRYYFEVSNVTNQTK